VWLVAALPGLVVALFVSTLRFDLVLETTPLVVLVIVLVALTSTATGYSLAVLLHPTVAAMLTQVLVVFVLMFSPLTFPPERLPGWLASVHAVAPIQSMGELLRGTIIGGAHPVEAMAFVTFGLWAGISLIITSLVMARRG
jgi:ABC-2 type transport system permease protein